MDDNQSKLSAVIGQSKMALFFFPGPIQSELHVPQKYKPIKTQIKDHFDIQVIISIPIGPQYMKITKRAYNTTYMDNISHLDGVCLIKR